MTRLLINILQAMDMACWGLIPRFWVKDKGFKEDDAVWGENAQKSKPADPRLKSSCSPSPVIL